MKVLWIVVCLLAVRSARGEDKEIKKILAVTENDRIPVRAGNCYKMENVSF